MENLESTVMQIRKHSRQLVRELDVVRGVYLDTGYTFTQCHVLFELGSHDGLHLMEIAENLLIDKSNTSRTVKKLVELGLVKSQKVKDDQRQKLFRLTAKGEKVLARTVGLADVQVENALANLSTEQHQQVIDGMRLYAEALRRSRLHSAYSIRRVEKGDESQIAKVIRQVMSEFGAVGEGYSIEDPEVDSMHANYQSEESCYYVVATEKKVFGGGGIARLQGGPKTTCELRKMFFLPELRGLGLGRKLLELLLDEARRRGYRHCYLETLDRMEQATNLYVKAGFELLDKPQGNTGHCACDRWYRMKL